MVRMLAMGSGDPGFKTRLVHLYLVYYIRSRVYESAIEAGFVFQR